MRDAAIRPFMASHGWLAATPPHFRDEVLSRCITRRAEKGQQIFGRGDPPGGLWGLVSGTVAIEVESGQETFLGHFAGPGYWIGAGPTITGQDRSVGVVATQASTLLLLPSVGFKEIAATDPEAWRWLAVLPMMQSLLALGIAQDLMIRSSRRRLVAILLRLGASRGPFAKADPEIITATQDEIAAMANLSRTATGKMLRELETTGCLSMGYRSIRIAPDCLRGQLQEQSIDQEE